MPEGDTIFRSARTLHRALAGKTITGFRSTYPLLTRFHDNTALTGQTIERVESRGKWVLMVFSRGGILVTHMRMHGSWHLYRPGERWKMPASAMRIVIETADFHAIGFNVPVARMHTESSLARDAEIPPAAADVLGDHFDEEAAVQRLLSEPERELGDALLRQRMLAGVGNVFKSETCFAAGLHPFCRIGSLSEAQVRAVVAAAQQQLAANVREDSGDRVVTYQGLQRRTTTEMNPGANLWVYGRTGLPCRRCGTAIRSQLQGVEARVTYWCPTCQRMPAGVSRVDSED